ncbi:MAG: hypothetical protein GQ581_08710 [Methyloprofundus sp.]|nr:hypothetical protein [Methyloprofundus sp.]
MKSKSNKSLAVALHAMDGRSLKTMMMFLQVTCKGIAQVVSEQEAEIDIIDIDLMGAKPSLEHCLARAPLRPIIVLSLQPVDAEHVIFIQKPAKVENMMTAFKEARLMLSRQKKTAKIKGHNNAIAATTKALAQKKPEASSVVVNKQPVAAEAKKSNNIESIPAKKINVDPASVLKVSLLGMDEQTRHTLTSLMQNDLQGLVQAAAEHEAEIDIVDADQMDAKTSLDYCLARKPLRSIIIISQERLNIEGTIYVSSPVNAGELLVAFKQASPKFDSANQILSSIDVDKGEAETKKRPPPSNSDFVFGLNKALPKKLVADNIVPEQAPKKSQNVEKALGGQVESSSAKKPKPSTKNIVKQHGKRKQEQIKKHTEIMAEKKDKPLSQGAKQHEITALAAETKVYVKSEEQKKVAKHQAAMQINEQRFSSFIGLVEGVDFSDPKQWAIASYNPKHYYQGYVQSTVKIAFEKSIAVKLNSAWKPLILLPRSHEILLDADDKQLRAFAGVNVKSMPISTTKIMSIVPVNIAEEAISTDLEKFQDLNSFLWKLACWTSKGRYIAALDLERPIYLTQWPNFTRLVVTPHAMRIASLLVAEPRAIPDIVQVLKIKPQYVFIFISAAYTIGILEQINNQDKAVTMEDSVSPVRKKAQKKGLLNRILNKLRA